jgi:thioredoxin 1
MATTVKKFSASWCGPCKMLAPMMESIKPTFNGVKFENIDIDENAELAAKYGVRSVPTVIVEKDGVEVNRFVGVQSAMTYRNAINETL